MAPTDIQLDRSDAPPGIDATAQKEPTLRNQDIEEATNRLIIHRASMALIPLFIKARITPNCVSCLGALSGLAAAWFYYGYENPIACLLGFLFMAGWHVFDGADGQLARLTGQTSPLGFVIDGVCDYVTFIFVYVALALALTPTFGQGVWLIVVTAGVFHAVQAAAYEMQREFYIRWTGDKDAICLEDIVNEESSVAAANIIARTYKAIQEYFRPISSATERRLVEIGLDGTRRARVRDAYRQHFMRPVKTWSILSANNRTIAIFLFCLAGQPLGFFVYEITVLSLALYVLIRLNRKAATGFTQQMGLQD